MPSYAAHGCGGTASYRFHARTRNVSCGRRVVVVVVLLVVVLPCGTVVGAPCGCVVVGSPPGTVVVVVVAGGAHTCNPSWRQRRRVCRRHGRNRWPVDVTHAAAAASH